MGGTAYVQNESGSTCTGADAMPWELIGDVPVTFEGVQLGTPLIGDALIKIEHTFDFADFPGVGYAVISDLVFGWGKGPVYPFLSL